MELNVEIAQAIVQRTIKVVDYVVNIMDTKGRIIASADPKRIGEIHYGAQQVIKTGKSFIMNEERAKKFQNVVPGISLPIHFRGELVGVVGIGSGTEAAQKYGDILQFTTELLLEQITLQEEYELREKSKENFFRELLLGSYQNSREYFDVRAKTIGIDTQKSYRLYLCKMKECESGNEEDILVEEQRKRIKRSLEYGLPEYLHIQVAFIASYVVILIPREYDEKEEMADILSGIIEQSSEVEDRICISEPAEELYDIPRCYSKAVVIYQFQRQIKNQKIIRVEDSQLEYLFLHTNAEDLQQYVIHILAVLINENAGQKETLLETLDTFFEYDMNVGKTAEALYIHRNTLAFRLNRIYKLTGLNPSVFGDAVRLYIAMMLWKNLN